jgi:tetratricopeptide (TPR) repeat protein
MARKQLGLLVIGLVCFALAPLPARAGDKGLKKELDDLNRITGSEVTVGALRGLIDDKEHAKALLKFALPAAKKKELSYNAALALGMAAADMKDLKTAEIFLRVCMDKAAKLQSLEKLLQSYGLLIDLYYDEKQYAESARLCKEVTELNTDDGKDRIVIQTMTNRFDEVDFREPQEGFNLAQRIRPYVFESHVKAIAKQGKFEQALAMVDKELKGKEEWDTQHLKGWVLKEAGKLEDAADIFETVIQQVEKDDRLTGKRRDDFALQYRYEVSNIYLDLKKIDQASEHLEFIIKKRPDDPRFYNDLGFIWADNNMKLEEAEKLIRKALELDRAKRKKDKGAKFNADTDHDSGAYLDSLGWVLFRQKKTQEAKKWLLLAVEDKDSRHIEIYDHLGDVLMVLGDRTAAIKAWEDGLKFVNDNRRDAERKASVEKKLEKAKATK